MAMVASPLGLFRSLREIGVEAYLQQLHACGERLSILLRMKEETFSAMLSKDAPSGEICLFLVSVALYHSPPSMAPILEGGGEEEEENWRGEYWAALDKEFASRVLRLAIRSIPAIPEIFNETFDLLFWCRLLEALHEGHGRLAQKLAEDLFKHDPRLREIMAEVWSRLLLLRQGEGGEELTSSKLSLICILFCASCPDLRQVSLEDLVTLLIAIGHTTIPRRMLKYLSLWPFWSEIDIKRLAILLNESDPEASNRLATLLLQEDGPLQMIGTALGEEGMGRLVGQLVEILPNLTLEEAHTAIRESGGDLEAALIRATTSRWEKEDERKDECLALLDDKTFVRQYKKDIIASVEDIYNDEYVDTYDETLESRLDQSNIQTHKSADNIGGKERELLQAYISNPSLFSRSSQVRKSNERMVLCERLGLSHEQIEGWMILFERNPRREIIMRDYALLHPEVSPSRRKG